jgi:hypothetical protein
MAWRQSKENASRAVSEYDALSEYQEHCGVSEEHRDVDRDL